MKGLVFTYLLIALGTAGGLWQPRLGLFVYVAFAVLRPQNMWGYGADLTGISRLVGICMLVGWLLRGFGTWRFQRGAFVVVSFVAFMGWSGLAASFASDPEIAWTGLVNMSKILLPFMVGVTLFRGPRDARILLWTIVGALGWVSYELNMNYLLNSFNQAREVGYGGLDNNGLGIGLVTVLGPAIGLTLSARRWPARILGGVIALLILHATLLTFSRGAMLGLLVLVVSAAIILPKRPKYLAAAALFALLAVRLTGPELLTRYESTFVSEDELDGSARSRISLWGDLVEIAAANPVFGVGPQNWRLMAVDFGWGTGKSGHSLWLETAAETGFPGLAALILFYGGAVWCLWPMARARRDVSADDGQSAMATGIIAGLFGFAVSAQFVTLPGLEIPYYVTMTAVVLMQPPREVKVKAAAPVEGRRPVDRDRRVALPAS